MSGNELQKCSVCTAIKRNRTHATANSKMHQADMLILLRDIDDIAFDHAMWHMKHRILYGKAACALPKYLWCLTIDGYDRHKSYVPRNTVAAHDSSLDDKNLPLALIAVDAHRLNPGKLLYLYPSDVFGHDANSVCAVILDAINRLQKNNPRPRDG